MTDATNANANANAPAPGQGNQTAPQNDNQQVENKENKQSLNLDLNKQPENTDANKNPQAPEKPEDKNNQDENKDTPVEFEKVGYAGVDFALDYISKLGFKADSEAVKQAYLGNFDMIEAELAINPKAHGYDKVLELAKRDYKQIVDKYKQEAVEIENNVLKVFGGDEGKVQEVLEYARNNADDNEKTILNEMLNAGPYQAMIAASFLKHSYETAKGTTVRPNEAADRFTQQQPSQYALSPADYLKAVQELKNKVGYVDGHPEYAKLQQRRRAYRG